LFWSTVAGGLALPWLVIVACEAYYGSSAEIAKFPHQLFAEGNNYFSVGLMNALPFVPGGVIVQWAANRRREGTAAAAHTMAAAVMAVATLALSLWGQFSVWRSTFNPGSRSSTAAIGLYVLVILGFALVPVSYLAGWLAGKIVFSDPASWKLLRRPELMTEDNANKARKAFWVVALIGFLLPWIVIICCQIYVGIAAEIRNFPAHLFESGYNFFFLAVMNATPFVIVAVAARVLLKARQERRTRRGRLAGLGTSAACAMIVSLFAQIGVWSSVFKPKTHASLAGLGIYIEFWAALAVLPIGYLLGWAVGTSVRLFG
jgi:hypothetical protein